MSNPGIDYVLQRRKIYVLGVVLTALALLIAVLSWREGNLRSTVIGGGLSLSQIIVTVDLVRRISKREKAGRTRRVSKRTEKHKRQITILRTVGMITSIISVVGIFTTLIMGVPLHSTLMAVWGVLFGGVILFIIVPIIPELDN